MDRGAWRATVPGVAKSQTQLSNQHTHTVTVEFSSRVHSRIQKFELMSISGDAGHHVTHCEVTPREQNTIDLKL